MEGIFIELRRRARIVEQMDKPDEDAGARAAQEHTNRERSAVAIRRAM